MVSAAHVYWKVVLANIHALSVTIDDGRSGRSDCQHSLMIGGCGHIKLMQWLSRQQCTEQPDYFLHSYRPSSIHPYTSSYSFPVSTFLLLLARGARPPCIRLSGARVPLKKMCFCFWNDTSDPCCPHTEWDSRQVMNAVCQPFHAEAEREREREREGGARK
jgi:hypothetical protein